MENEPEYVWLTTEPEDEDSPVSIWAEVGPITDGRPYTNGPVQIFWEVDEHGTRLLEEGEELAIMSQVGDSVTEPARMNPDTGKLERVL